MLTRAVVLREAPFLPLASAGALALTPCPVRYGRGSNSCTSKQPGDFLSIHLSLAKTIVRVKCFCSVKEIQVYS